MASPAKRKRVEAVKGEGSEDDIKLYSYWRSSCSYRVRIALEWKRVPYTYIAVHLVKDGGEQLAPKYAALNSMKQVPTLVAKGNALTQSTAIIEYLEDAFPERRLYPADALLRARVRQVVEVIGSGIQPIQNLAVLKRVMALHEEGDARTKAKIEWGHYWIDTGFKALEAVLKETAGTFCVGDEVTAADLFLVPQVYNARRFKVDMSQFPIISRIEEKCQTLDAFKAAHPSAQPDAES